MPIHNVEIADAFDHLADLLEIQQANRFRVRAYRNAARTVRNLGRSLADMLENGEDLSELPDIGKDLAGKIAEFVDTGHLAMLDEVSKAVPEGLVDVTAIPGIGPKRAQALFRALDIRSRDDLRKAAEAGRIAQIAGFGERTQARIRDELARGDVSEQRFRLALAEDFAEPLVDFVRKIEGVTQATVAGSYRRRKETVGDLDILVTAKAGRTVIERFVKYDEVTGIVSQGDTRSTVILRSGLQVDLRVVPEVSYGAAMHYFTGSKSHNIACRRRAQARGLKLNEYGVFKGRKRVAGKTEESVYEAVGLPWIAPVLRESRGEIEAAEDGSLPDLVEETDIRGDLHCHTDASDGRATLREMAEAAQARGYEYLAICDHSQSRAIANGLDEKRLHRQMEQIDALNEEYDGFRLLRSSEVDILRDGRLDYPDSLLKQLDLVVAAVHSDFELDEAAQTQRILRALDNPHVDILAHPTGRLIGERRAYAVDVEKLVEAAKQRGCHLELNANPLRLDLNDVSCRMARDLGVKISIATDAHTTRGLENMRYGIDQAQRGWLGPEDVLNAGGWKALSSQLRSR